MSDGTVPQRWKRNLVFFLTGQTVSLFGSMIVQYAVMWYVTLQTQSGLAVALYAVAAFLPQGLMSIFGGTLADRVNRKVLVMTADAVIAVVTLFLALLMLSGITDLWIILLAVAVRSLGAGVQQPTVQAIVPQLVPSDQLLRVNGIFQTIQSIMALVAPAAAAAIFAFAGIVPVFFLDVVTAAIGIGMLALVSVPALVRSAEKTTYFRDLAAGLSYVRSHVVVRWLLGVFAILFVLTVAPSFTTPLMVVRTFGTEAWKLAALEIAFSVGMMLGGVMVSTLLAKKDPMRMIVVATYGFALFTILQGLSPNLYVFYGFMFLFGLMVPPFSTPFMTLFQRTVEPQMHGRMFSYVGIVFALATPVGTAIFGPLADVISVQLLLVIAGLVTMVVFTVAILLPSGRAAFAASRETAQAGAPEDDGAGDFGSPVPDSEVSVDSGLDTGPNPRVPSS